MLETAPILHYFTLVLLGIGGHTLMTKTVRFSDFFFFFIMVFNLLRMGYWLHQAELSCYPVLGLPVMFPSFSRFIFEVNLNVQQ